VGAALFGAALLFGSPQAESALRTSATAKLAPPVRRALEVYPRYGEDTRNRGLIIQLREPVSPADFRAVESAGARITQRYERLPMVAVSAPGSAIGRLAGLPAVTRISPDYQVQQTLDYAGPAVGATVAQRDYRLTGKGVGVAVIDSGIAYSNDLNQSYSSSRSRVVAGYDFVARKTTYQKNDPCGHGSCVAGIIAGNAYNSRGLLASRQFYGVAPEVNLVNLRVLDRNGAGSVANVIAAIDWCLRNKVRYNIRVINLSLGHAPGESYTTDPMCQAVERAWKSGILVVVAAGNRGRKDPSNPNGGAAYGTINSPANDPYVLTVGATNDFNTGSIGDDGVASYSSRGPSRLNHILKPDLVAPGNKIISIRHRGSLLETVLAPANLVSPLYYLLSVVGLGTSSEYFEFSGTSMATPMVAGAAALMFQQDRSLTPDDVKARLMLTARKMWRADGTTPDIFSRGAGYLNIPAALRCRFRVTSPAISPYCTNHGGRVTVHTEQAIWSDMAVWDDQTLRGDQAIWGDQAVWDEMAVWDDQAIWSDMAVWDDQAIWSDISRVAIKGD
jgi:serine protease AprX